ncbi:putative esterase [Rubidibacter lacunae KORDI 51-2]|uniref:Putative esterase n=1 Tax=Rubidibacter lacunae KORDI 51-2 TaxID=582515 RepID=U5DI26_9CHRO|nr:dienelactone hydrolase family protein [Rubidibacter lacunae]ERN41326.1 putative esterase [Rubidibacter lacunae KORDI 51-2]
MDDDALLTTGAALDSIAISPRDGRSPHRLFVGLHGWGANAADLAGLAPLLALDNCLLAFPDAPFPHPYVAGGRAWYDLERRDVEQLEFGRQLLQAWMVDLLESSGIPSDRTVLCGFSQGGAMALDVGLVQPLAGVVCLSGYLHAPPNSPSTFPPVLLVHGTLDPVVPVSAARQARSVLDKAGVTVDYREFEMQHEIPPPVVALVQKFLAERME